MGAGGRSASPDVVETMEAREQAEKQAAKGVRLPLDFF